MPEAFTTSQKARNGEVGSMETRVAIAGLDDWRETVTQALEVLERGELVALPTETVYGLGADALNPEAVANIFTTKERPEFDPLIVHIGKKKDLNKVALIPEDLEETVQGLIDEFWPGPLTLVLPKQAVIPDMVTAGLPTVAVRMSAHEVMQEVCKKFGPIAAPSANKFGRISPTSAKAVEAELGGEIPLIIDGGACIEGLESTIVAPQVGEKRVELRVLRPGPVMREELRAFGKVLMPKKRRVVESPEAPGQLASHYAPRKKLLLFEKAEDFVPEEGVKYGLLSYRGEKKDGYVDKIDWASVEILSPGKGKLSEAAVRFFHCLRKLDNSDVDVIVAEPVSETSLGVAIMDRLRRASYSED